MERNYQVTYPSFCEIQFNFFAIETNRRQCIDILAKLESI